MSIYRKRPQASLRPFVDWLWYYVDFYPDHDREHVLPDGTFELMINLQDVPRKLFHRDLSGRHEAFKRGWISGAHTRYLIIDAIPCSSMIGVHFRPGGAAPFLGMPADKLGNAVVELDGLWGQDIWEWRERLLAAKGPEAKFRILEALLISRLHLNSRRSGIEPAVGWAVDRMAGEPNPCHISKVADHLGISHKHFIHLFKTQVGMTPKKFLRVQRFQQVLSQIQAPEAVDWADVACGCGYFDQAHFIHDFTTFSGMNPLSYLERRLDGDTKFARGEA